MYEGHSSPHREEQYQAFLQAVGQLKAVKQAPQFTTIPDSLESQLKHLVKALLKGFSQPQQRQIYDLLKSIIEEDKVYQSFSKLLEVAQTKPMPPDFKDSFKKEGIELSFGLGFAFSAYAFPHFSSSLNAYSGGVSHWILTGVAGLILGSKLGSLHATVRRYQIAQDSYQQQLERYNQIWEHAPQQSPSLNELSSSNEEWVEPDFIEVMRSPLHSFPSRKNEPSSVKTPTPK